MKLGPTLPERLSSSLCIAASALLAALAVFAAGCSSSGGQPGSSAQPPSITSATATTATSAANNSVLATVTVKAREYSFEAPDSIPAGLTRVHMDNVGSEDHQAQLLKLNQGVSMQQFSSALQKGPTAALALVTAEGGPNAEAPSQSAEAISDLQPGQYVFICFVPSADGVPHLAKGMIKPFQVTAASSTQKAELPPAKETVTLREFNFEAPQTLPAGQTTIAVKNAGTQPHEMSLVKLNNGVSADQFKAAAVSTATPPPGPPPFSSAGGMGGIGPGATGETTVDLKPGSYALVCNIPDAASGKPHVQLGMVWTVTVK